MKILHLYKNYYPTIGGIERHIQLLCEELAKDQNFQVQVMVANTRFKTEQECIAGVPVVRAARVCEFALTPISLSLLQLVKNQKPDLIHLHFPYPIGELASLLAGARARSIVTYHGDVVRQKALYKLYEPLVHMTLRRAESIIGTNPNYLASSPVLRQFKSKTQVIPLGIDLTRFSKPDSEQVSQIQSRFGKKTVLFVGRFRHYKGLEVLLRAAPHVNGLILLIGEGPLKPELLKMAKEIEVDDKVIFLGEVDDTLLVSYYHSCALAVLPSTNSSEAFGLTLLEAMACGKPIVSTELGTGTSYVNQSGFTGLVVPPNDAPALAEAINYLLDHPKDSLSMGEAGYQRVQKCFSVSCMAERTKRVYRCEGQ